MGAAGVLRVATKVKPLPGNARCLSLYPIWVIISPDAVSLGEGRR